MIYRLNNGLPRSFLIVTLHKKLETADLLTFTKEILNGNLHFLCGVTVRKDRGKRLFNFRSRPMLLLTVDVIAL